MLNNTMQDILIRRARMLGLNALWVHDINLASIAPKVKAVAMLKVKGIEKKNTYMRAVFGTYVERKNRRHYSDS